MKIDGKQVIAHLQSKWGNAPCPMCKKINWQVNNTVFQLTEFNIGSMVFGGPLIPLIPISCGNCGLTQLINAIQTGVVAAPIAEQPQTTRKT